MYSNNRLVYDEKEEGGYLYHVGFEGEFAWRKVRLICKYMINEFGYVKAKAKTQLIKFCEEHDENFNYISNRKTINWIVNRAMKDEYKFTIPVDIRLSEIETIRKIKNFKYQKILLCMLFLVKQNPNKKGISISDFGKIRSLMNKKHLSNQEIEVALGLFWSDGYVGEPKGYYPLTFISENPRDRKIFAFKNTDRDARLLVETYFGYCGGELGYCKVCGQEFVKSSQHSLYCTIHSEEKRKEKYKRYNSKRDNHL